MDTPERPEEMRIIRADAARRILGRRLLLTRAGMACERVTRAFWPLWSFALVVLAGLMFGLHDRMPVLGVQIAGALCGVALLWFLISGLRRFRLPGADEARARLDGLAPHHPLAALTDRQATGVGDAAARAVWQAHLARMEQAAQRIRAPAPDLRLSRHDPYALRYVALLFLATALLFGSIRDVGGIAVTGPSETIHGHAGPVWEGWIDPPAHTGLPGLYLNDQPQGRLQVVEGSRIDLRLYAADGALSVRETISGQSSDAPVADPEQSYVAQQDGVVQIESANGAGAEWQVVVLPDLAPAIRATAAMDRSVSGELRQPFAASDDYGVVSGTARFELDLKAVPRRHGLAPEPDPRDPVTLDLPLTISGDRRDFDETLVENLATHPWAGLPVIMHLQAVDAAGQTGDSPPEQRILPARRFFDPTARAVAETRRDLLWARAGAPRVALLLRAISHRPGDAFDSASAYLMLRAAIRQIEASAGAGMTPEVQAEVAGALWRVAVEIEDGDIGDALERLRQAQQRLLQAMREGASDTEIAELMDALRDAVRDYMRQLARNPDSTIDQPDQGERRMLSQQDLRDMMDRIEELMRQGRMAEAEALMRQFQQMMENLRMTDQGGEGGEGSGGGGAGAQALEGLADILRQQQGLSDEAFRDLQEQFNPGARAGRSPGNTGRNGGEGRGQSHDGEGGRSGPGSGDGDDGGFAGRDDTRDGDGAGDALADRQQALRQELGAQEQGLPGGADGPEGEAAREALDQAGRAMEQAERALRDDDLPGALDRQAQAMEALREGMRQLSEALAGNRAQGGQGQRTGQSGGGQVDPLGRTEGRGGVADSRGDMLRGEDVYRRARELLEELRSRSSDRERPERELDYLRRLLDRF